MSGSPQEHQPPDLMDVAMRAAVLHEAGEARSPGLLKATAEMVRPVVQVCLADVLARRRELVEMLLEAVTDRAGHPPDESPDQRFRDGYETGLALAAIVLGVAEAASPQRDTMLPAWLADDDDRRTTWQ